MAPRDPVADIIELHGERTDPRASKLDVRLIASELSPLRGHDWLGLFIEGSTYPMFVADDTGRIVEANSKTCEQLGYTRRLLLKMTVYDVSNLDPSAYRRLFDLPGPAFQWTEHRSSDGRLQRAPCHVRRVELQRESFLVFLECPSDDSSPWLVDPVRAASQEALVVIDELGGMVWLNPLAEELFEQTPEEAWGRSLDGWCTPELAEAVAELADRLKTGEMGARPRTIRTHVLRGLERIPVSVSMWPIRLAGHAFGVVSLDELALSTPPPSRESSSPRHSMVVASRELQKVLDVVELLAPADSPVLVVGETGTGKELVARAIHDLSRRAHGPFISVNCAAFPLTLIDSELFGHERGAFTGATSRKIGWFEAAQGGTLFFDEIAELPVAQQARLLRALQERVIHRVGGRQPIELDVRFLAATNRDLAAMVASGEFREDLYFRLNVVPIVVPPLRERPEDIAALAKHFVAQYTAKLGKRLAPLSRAQLHRLAGYRWPGNVRELQNVIERAVLLSRGPELDLEVALGSVPGMRSSDPSEAEKKRLLDALNQTAWRVSGPRGAARLVGLKPTTFEARMKRLGIHRP